MQLVAHLVTSNMHGSLFYLSQICDLSNLSLKAARLVLSSSITYMTKYKPGGYSLIVRRSRTGKGLFTEEDIPKGACIIEYIGRPVSEERVARDNGKYYFEVDKNVTIDGNIPANIARYINHSCRSNCEAIGPRGKVFIFSRKNIKAGSELTYDYGKEYFERHIKPKGCLCEKCGPGSKSA